MLAAYMAALPEGRESRRELELIPAGEFMMRPHDGRGPYYNRDPEAIIQRTQARGYSLVFDYDHATELTKETGVPAPASGWIKRLFVRDGAVWGEVDWTDRAAAAIDAKEYRYYSPVFMHDASGNVLAIRTAGLTNDPAMFVRALSHANGNLEEAEMDLAKLRKALGLSTTATEAEILAAATAAGLLKTGMAELRTAMGLGDDASVTAIATAMTALRAGLKAIATAAGLAEDANAADVETAVKAAKASAGGTDGLKAIATAAGLAEDASAADIETAVKAAKASAGGNDDPGAFVPRAEFDRLKQDLTSLQQGSAKTAAETAVASAIEAGKVTPASREWALAYAAKDPDGFATFVKDAPAILSNGRVAPSGDPDKGGTLTEQEKAICRATGVTEEQFINSRKAIAEAGEEG